MRDAIWGFGGKRRKLLGYMPQNQASNPQLIVRILAKWNREIAKW